MIDKIETDEFVLHYINDAEAVRQKLLAWFLEHQCFSGESVAQCDAPQLTAPDLLGELADEVFCFKVEWKE